MAASLITHVLVTATLAGLVAVLCRAIRLAPVVRHALWLVVLIKFVTPPLLVVRTPWTWPSVLSLGAQLRESMRANDANADASVAVASQPESSVEERIANIAEPQTTEASRRDAIEPVTAAPPETRSISLDAVASTLWFVWLAGTAVFLGIQGGRLFRIARLMRRATMPDAEFAERVEMLARRLGGASARVRVVPGISTPFIVGFGRTTLLWPSDLSDTLSERSLDGLIIHELAHVKRRDHWVGWLELAAGAMWWWNPLFWYVRAQTREQAELACDAWVIDMLPHGRRAYAEALVTVCAAVGGVAPVPIVGINSSSRRALERRLTLIMRGRNPARLPRFAAAGAAILLTLAVPVWAQHAAVSSSPVANRLLPQSATDAPEPLPASVNPPSVPARSAASQGSRASRAPQSTLPVDAQELVNRFSAQEEAQRREVDARIAGERQTLIRNLQALQTRYTQAGRLDEALAIRNRVRQLESGSVSSRVTPSQTAAFVAGEALELRTRPSNVTAYGRVGEIVSLTATGTTSGSVWGTDVYTDDSSIGAAAVHAGLLRPGETAVVQLRRLPGQSSYVGSTENGVTSGRYGPWDGSFEFVARGASVTPPAPRVPSTSLGANWSMMLRDHPGETFTVPVVGSANGNVWGDGVYTDDSSIAAAAVHSGAILRGEVGFVRVTALPGRDHYEGSSQNGVTSRSYGAWDGSFSIEPETSPSPLIRWPNGGVPPEFMRALRSRGGSFLIDVVGAAGAVWGSDVYTDDSSLAAAAVHAGLLKFGERGTVRVVLLPGRSSYEGSTRNGVTTRPYEDFGGSFQLERGR